MKNNRDLLTCPLDHEKAQKVCQRYLKEDFDKIVQHDKSDVNLMRCYTALVEEAKKLSDEVIRLMKVEASLNTVPRPEMGEPKEDVAIKIDFSCTQGSDEPTPSFRFIDANSGVMIMDVRMSYESFGQLMTGLGHRPAKARIFDTFKVIGLYTDSKYVYITAPKSWDEKQRKAEIKKIIAEACADDLASGWFVSSDGTGTQQHSPNGWKIILARYVKAKPADKGYAE